MKKLLSFGTCLALGLTVVGASSALADAATFYFDNDTAKWDAVNVWAWTDDEMWALDNGFEAWPGIALEKDATTGYYIYNCEDYVDGANIMFNDNGAGKQTNDAAAAAAVPGKVCVVTDADADGKFNAEWKDVAASGAADTTASDDKKDDAAADTTTATDDKKDDAAADTTTTATTTDDKKETAAAGKTADTATVAAVAMLGLASMAVVVATRKKIA